METLSQQAAAFLASDVSDRIGPDLRDVIEVAFLDTAGCILSGRAEPVTRHISGWLESRAAGQGQAHVLFSDRTIEPIGAAALNALSGHALDFDDVSLTGHPSVVLVPALLAEAETGGLDGTTLLQGYVKGYEVWADLLRRLPDPLHEKGWHPTAVLGTMAVAAAICAARAVRPDTAVNALGLAASLASGLIANFGTMAKPMHAYWAVEKGMQAVAFAQLGLTASADALDGRGGLLLALAAAREPDLSSPFSGFASLALETVRPSIKKYPVCYAAHRVIDGLLDLRRRYGLEEGGVRAVHAYVSPTNRKVLKYAAPQTPLEAKFSMNFACASSIVLGEVSLGSLSPACVSDPRIRRLMELVEVHDAEGECPVEPGFALHDRVRVERVDGTWLDSGDIRFARGHARLPLTRDEVEAKVLQCVAPEEAEFAKALIARLSGLLRAPAP